MGLSCVPPGFRRYTLWDSTGGGALCSFSLSDVLALLATLSLRCLADLAQPPATVLALGTGSGGSFPPPDCVR